MYWITEATMKWWAIVLGMVVLPIPSKGELLPIRTYSTADGLAADSVYGIFADSRGFLWFSTMEGISRFDGYRFITYGVEEGLPHGVISAMIETRSGEHWIGTPRGLSRIAASGASARFTNYRLGPDAASNNIGTLLELRSGSLLAATAGGLFEWTTPGSFQHQDLYGIDPQSITDMVEDAAGNVWIGSTTGIYVRGPGGIVQHFSIKNGLPGDWVQSLLFDSKGRLWAALRGGLAMIGRAPSRDWRVEQVYGPHSALSGLDVMALHEASDGTLWVGTGLGLSRLSWPDGNEPVIENLTRSQGLSDREILSIGEDQAGNIWAGTEGAGVMRIDRLGFTTYREQDGLATDRVFSVFGDRAGRMLTVTSGAGSQSTHSVDIFDGVRFHSLSAGKFTEDPSWGWDRILLQSRTGEWWGATDHGLCRYGSIKAEQLNHRQPTACYSDDTVFRIFEDSKGGIWSSGQSKPGNRIRRWDPQTNQVFTFPVPVIPGGRTDDLIGSFAEDAQGNIWMGLWVGGLYRYDGHSFRYFQKSDGIPAGSVLALLADGNRLKTSVGSL
jgi:ligand-binding sensor domain-containing protein